MALVATTPHCNNRWVPRVQRLAAAVPSAFRSSHGVEWPWHGPDHAALVAKADAAGEVGWDLAWTPPSTGPTSTRPRWRAPRRRPGAAQGAGSNHTNPFAEPRAEPADHALGRSRGGMSTKVHRLVDGRGRPLVVLVAPGQAGDSPMLAPVLAQLRVARAHPGRPRTRPSRLIGDKAFSSRAHRALLLRRGIIADRRALRPVHPPPSPRPPRRPAVGLRRPDLQAAQRRRARVQPAQGLARPGHPLRQARPHLPRRSSPASNPTLATNLRDTS